MLIFPGVIFGAIRNVWDNGFWRFWESAFQGGSYIYTIVEIAAIFFFAYFWTTVQFRPKEMANNLRDYGSFIPGLRPGKRTADYLEKVMGRITYVGAGFLALIAIIPTLVATSLQIPFIVSAFLGGTGLLIVVSVTLDMVQRIEANLIMRNYKGFLGDVGPIKGSRT
jgi:preprotein translocase subunit SecY